jgi:hypothetical protein
LPVDELKIIAQASQGTIKSHVVTNKDEPMDEETFKLLQSTTRKLSQKWSM